ncbi:hypothetical protein OBV_p-00500 (plasmid) [Oscillibacter valericigenes Sjm18-20]|nr:hypothetical protein OBV_p-00500 [Oscillibacter valericigenes Sjm18-20]
MNLQKVNTATDTVILSRLTSAAKEHNVVLTFTHKKFFLRLLNVADSNGYDADGNLFVEASVQELSKLLNIPARTTMQSITRLVECGALRRIAGVKTFPRSPTETVILKQFYYDDKKE